MAVTQSFCMFLAFGARSPALRQALSERCAIVAAKLECFKSRRDNHDAKTPRQIRNAAGDFFCSKQIKQNPSVNQRLLRIG